MEMNKKIISKKINDINDAKAFISHLVQNESSFHFDDDASDIIDKEGNKFFSDEDAIIINDRLDEMYNLDWSNESCQCPIGYELKLLKEIGRL